ncbi:MAG: M20/M25/M40 family metallo-hydrolase [Thermoanaerobaculia bacterium]
MTNVIEILRDLVSFNTVSSKPTAGILEYVISRLEKVGFTCETFGEDGRFQNLIARNAAAIGWNPEAPRYRAFCGHVDTVPFDRNAWINDPFELTEVEGMLHGLGASDMKGALASMLVSLESVAVSDPSAPLALVLTHHEETALEGANELVRSTEAMARLQPMQLIIGEPTGLSIGYAHKGVFDFSVTVRGRAAHSGSPHRGLNAIYAASEIVTSIAGLQVRWNETSDPRFESGNAVNVGILHGGDVRNRVPDQAELAGDARLLPGTTPDEVIGVIERDCERLRHHGFRCDLQKDFSAPAFEMDRDSGFIAELHDITRSERLTLGYATDAAVLQGIGGLECAVLGPGDIRVCHMPNECIEKRQLDAAVSLYSRILLNQPCATVSGATVDIDSRRPA